MLKFFSKIRQKLLSENKISKYLLYAIGEIALVVIGILIAVKINNWNEAKKKKEVEIEILSQFKEDLKDDIESINRVDLWVQKAINSSKIVVDHLKNERAWHDTLAIHFDLWNDYDHLGLNTVAISNLRSRGVEIVSNKELRKNIIQLYDNWYFYIKKSNDNFREDHIYLSYPKYLQHIEPVKWRVAGVPSDYDALLKDKEFINTVQWIRNAAEFTSEFYLLTIQEIQKVINDIDLELEKF